jgi:methylmalonyl-CoA/ethylmalonyl-CoA epimerase
LTYAGKAVSYMKEPAIENIEEVVIAVKDARKAAVLFNNLFGMKFETEWDMPHENMIVKSERISGTQLQFVESTSPEGVIAKFIEGRGEGLNHIAFKVSNLKEMASRLRGKGVKLIPEEPIEMRNPLGEGMWTYVFIHPRSACGTLIELIETGE